MFAKTTSLMVLLAFPCMAFPRAPAWIAGMDLTVESAFGLAGAARSGGTAHGTALAHLDWEQTDGSADRLSWSGTISVLGVAGHGPTERFAGDFLALSNIEACRGTRLYTWWLQAGRSDWSVRAGALLADEEFTGSDAAGGLLNSAFGWPAFISANTVNTGPAYFVPAIGVRLERTFHDSWAWRTGIYDGDTFDSPDGDPSINDEGLHFKLGGKQGWFLISEIGWAPEGSKTSLKAGAWYHTADFADRLDDNHGRPYLISGNEPRTYSCDYGLYALVERSVIGTGGEPGSVDLFVRAGISPASRNTVSRAIDLGFAWTGPIPGRGTDVLTIGTACADFSSHYSGAFALEDPTSPKPDYERVIEAGYTWSWSDSVSVQPDFQYILHTGGSAAQGDALVFLIRLNASY